MPRDIPDHPGVSSAMANGSPDGETYYCPICAEEAEVFYVDTYGAVLGCDNCIEKKDPWNADGLEV